MSFLPVPGCSTGEEAYSIAMLLREYMDHTQNRFAVQVFVTDMDKKFVEFARTGLYPAAITEDLSPERLDRFFDKVGPEYKIKDYIRSMRAPEHCWTGHWRSWPPIQSGKRLPKASATR
jgi:two-component system CheB/CheR fusion protein